MPRFFIQIPSQSNHVIYDYWTVIPAPGQVQKYAPRHTTIIQTSDTTIVIKCSKRRKMYYQLSTGMRSIALCVYTQPIRLPAHMRIRIHVKI